MIVHDVHEGHEAVRLGARGGIKLGDAPHRQRVIPLHQRDVVRRGHGSAAQLVEVEVRDAAACAVGRTSGSNLARGGELGFISA